MVVIAASIAMRASAAARMKRFRPIGCWHGADDADGRHDRHEARRDQPEREDDDPDLARRKADVAGRAGSKPRLSALARA